MSHPPKDMEFSPELQPRPHGHPRRWLALSIGVGVLLFLLLAALLILGREMAASKFIYVDF